MCIGYEICDAVSPCKDESKAGIRLLLYLLQFIILINLEIVLTPKRTPTELATNDSNLSESNYEVHMCVNCVF